MHTSYFKKLTKTVSVVALAAAVGFGTTYASVRSLLADAASAGNTVNVKDYGAKGDGDTDDSDAIQKAINAIKAKGGKVFIPAGLYYMESGVTVPPGVSIVGTTPAATGPWQNHLDSHDKGGNSIYGGSSGLSWTIGDDMRGTWILAANGIGNRNAVATFQLDGNTSIERVGFVNKSQYPCTSSPSEAPPLISVSTAKATNTSSTIKISDISLANPYIGIAIAQGSDFNNDYTSTPSNKSKLGTVTISNIMGSPQYKGIIIKGISTPVNLNNIQFNYSCYESNHVAERTNYATDIEVSGSDKVSLVSVLSFGANYGLMTKPAFSGRSSQVTAVNLNLESGIPLYLTASGQYEISNSYLFTICPFNASSRKEYRCLKIVQDKDCKTAPNYLFNNIMLQDPIEFGANTKNFNDSNIDITVDGGAKIVFNGMQSYGYDLTQKEPVIRYNHRSGGASSCQFINFNQISSASNPFISISGSAYKSGEVSVVSSRIPKQMSLPGANVKFTDCTLYDGANGSYYNN